MPELPEVETTRLSLLPHVKKQIIQKVELRRADLRFPFPPDFALRLTGATILDIRRRAKYLIFELDTGDIMLAHLGMSGSFTIMSTKGYKPRVHDHVLLHLSSGNTVIYNDPRRFGMMDVLLAGQEKTHKLLKDMGPEPLSKDFSTAYLKKALLSRNTPIKPLLMDQKIVVGVGNIYASESLFLAGIHPMAKSCDVAGQSAIMISSIQKTLRAAIKSGGSTLRNYVGADGASGYFQHQFNVYNREGLPCISCGTPISHIVQSGRVTYFCAQCQKQSSCQPPRAKKLKQKKQ